MIKLKIVYDDNDQIDILDNSGKAIFSGHKSEFDVVLDLPKIMEHYGIRGETQYTEADYSAFLDEDEEE
jgi:hypothetical protein